MLRTINCFNTVLRGLGAAVVLSLALTLLASPASAQSNSLTGSAPVNPQMTVESLSSGYVPKQCSQYLSTEYLVDCWLQMHPNIANAIIWEFVNPNGTTTTKAWPQWDARRTADLRAAYKNALLWYQSGMTNYSGVLAPDPAPNLDASFAMQNLPHNAVLDGPTAAWPLYIGHVGLSLAAEIHGWVPWSLRDYDATALGHLFTAYNNWYRHDTNNGFEYDSFTPGYIITSGNTPANATYVFKFLKDNNLIGPTPKDTIGQILNWSRWNMVHMFGSYSSQNMYHYWQHWGPVPVSRVIEGTITTDPMASNSFPTPQHWAAGCSGTSTFLMAVFRVVNIPATQVMAGQHATIWFSGINRYLSHGDDPYDQLSKTDYPAMWLLITKQTYDAWFPQGNWQTGNQNVGRRPVELAVWYPSDYVVAKYCQDTVGGLDHASGSVYNDIFKKYYTVQYLESTNLWQRLATKVATSTAWQCAPLQQNQP